jgi:hypothetical protein
VRLSPYQLNETRIAGFPACPSLCAGCPLKDRLTDMSSEDNQAIVFLLTNGQFCDFDSEKGSEKLTGAATLQNS